MTSSIRIHLPPIIRSPPSHGDSSLPISQLAFINGIYSRNGSGAAASAASSTGDNASLLPEADMCSVHHKALDIYCRSCKTCICYRCALFGEHKAHSGSVEPLEEVHEERVKLISGKLGGVKKRLADVTQLLDGVEKNQARLQTARDEKLEATRQASALHLERVEAGFERELTAKTALLRNQGSRLDIEARRLRDLVRKADGLITQSAKRQVIDKADECIKELETAQLVSMQQFRVPYIPPDFPNPNCPAYDHATFTIRNFRQARADALPLLSEPLTICGVAWRLRVYPDGFDSARGTHVSFLIQRDATIFTQRYEFRIELCHQGREADGSDADVGLNYSHYKTDHIFEGGNVGCGQLRFIALDCIEREGYWHAATDTLKFRFYLRPATFELKCDELDRYARHLESANRRLEVDMESLKNSQRLNNIAHNEVLVPQAAQNRGDGCANTRARKRALRNDFIADEIFAAYASVNSNNKAGKKVRACNVDKNIDSDETGVRDLDAFYQRRYGTNLNKSERYYNVYMGKLFELQPNEVFDGTPLLLRKATLNRIDDRARLIYTDADIRRDISCGLFPGGVPINCKLDEDLSELRALVYTEYIEFSPHMSKLIPLEMHCRCGICDCKGSCDGCACQKDACKCDTASKCPHKESFRFGCKRSKRCIYNAQVARNNNYLAPIDKHGTCTGTVVWSPILADGAAAGDKENVADEDVNTQLYEYLVMVCGPRCACPCAETMPIGYGPNPQLAGAFELRKTAECGWGVFTTRLITKGTYLFEYAGLVVSSDYVEKRKPKSHYVFDVPIADEMVKNMGGEEILCIDAADMGNLSRFVNHSCVENCIARRVFIGHTHSAMSRLVYFTRMDIAAGVELTLDYQWDWWVHMNKKYGMTCKCGEEKCKYTVELMPGVREAHRLERGEDDDDEDDSDDEMLSQNSVVVLPGAEIEAAAAAENAHENAIAFPPFMEIVDR